MGLNLDAFIASANCFVRQIDRAAALIGARQHQHEFRRAWLVVERFAQILNSRVNLALIQPNGRAEFRSASTLR